MLTSNVMVCSTGGSCFCLLMCTSAKSKMHAMWSVEWKPELLPGSAIWSWRGGGGLSSLRETVWKCVFLLEKLVFHPRGSVCVNLGVPSLDSSSSPSSLLSHVLLWLLSPKVWAETTPGELWFGFCGFLLQFQSLITQACPDIFAWGGAPWLALV